MTDHVNFLIIVYTTHLVSKWLLCDTEINIAIGYPNLRLFPLHSLNSMAVLTEAQV